MNYNHRKLRGRIVEKCGCQRNFAAAIGLSERSVSLKLNCIRHFKPSEITKACELLDIAEAEIPEYFFTQ